MNSGILLESIDQQMIIALRNGEAAGYYANYISMLNIFSIGISSLIVILLPTFTALISNKENQKLEFFKTKLYTYMSVFCLSLSCILFALAPQLTTLLFGNEYLTSGEFLRFTVLLYVFNVLSMINFTLLAALGKVRAKTLLTISIGVLNVILNYILIQYFGTYGVLSATII